MIWRVVLGNHAEKKLRRFPRKEKLRIAETIEALRSAPFAGDVVKLGGMGNAWRLRVGNYRIIFELFSKERMLFISEIVRRTSATY